MLARSQRPALQCCPTLTQLAAHHLAPDNVSTHQWAVRLQSPACLAHVLGVICESFVKKSGGG